MRASKTFFSTFKDLIPHHHLQQTEKGVSAEMRDEKNVFLIGGQISFGCGDISKNHQVRKKYTIQLGENELVLKELDLLNEDANVYKLIGPVLVKQDLAEANANVRKRIEYISTELGNVWIQLFRIWRKSKIARKKRFISYIKGFNLFKLEKARLNLHYDKFM
uniref:Prefoldin subunit 6 n=1 Tax=Lactuca sativa TaxID=4236 RepID=A0A9R1VDN3_LACSA|nr:hypothetical protein LSAT_V11C500239710 [Lactuca sativa]